MTACQICRRFLPATDRLPFHNGVACFACLVKATLTGRIGSKVLVFVKRTGVAFERNQGR